MPLYGLELMKQVIGELFPELAEIGFTDSRVSQSSVPLQQITDFPFRIVVLVHR